MFSSLLSGSERVKSFCKAKEFVIPFECDAKKSAVRKGKVKEIFLCWQAQGNLVVLEEFSAQNITENLSVNF